MTVQELKKALNEFPDNMEVFVAERKTEFGFGLVNSVYIKDIGFMEEPGGEPIAYDNVVVIDDD